MDEVLFGDPTGMLAREVRLGKARRIYPGLYTRDLKVPLEEIVRRNLWRIVAHYFPQGVITDRSIRQLSLPPLPRRVYVFLAHPARRRRIDLPGATVVARPGIGPLSEDPPFAHGARIASESRALLENARVTRSWRGLPPSTLSQAELEEWIDELAASRGPERLNRLRDQARAIAPTLGATKEFGVVDRLIGAALGTRPTRDRSRVFAALQTGTGE